MKRIILAALVGVLVSGPVFGDTDRWVPYPETSISTLWQFVRQNVEDARFLGTSGHSWPDGRQAVIYHFTVSGFLWRCNNYFDKDMRSTGNLCYRLGPYVRTITDPPPKN